MLTMRALAAMTALLAGGALLAFPAAAAGKNRLGEGDGIFRPVALGGLESVPLAGSLSPADREYLGIAGPRAFAIGELRHDVVVVELFNASCYACALMAPVMIEAWRRIQTRDDLRGRVRFLGVGVGNTAEQVREFHDRYDTPFPAVADPDFASFDALGATGGSPYLLLLRRTADGALEARGQVGYLPDAGRVVDQIVEALAGAPTAAGLAAMENAGGGWRNLKPALAEEELRALLVRAAAEAGLPGAVAARMEVPGEGTFFRVEAGGRHLWAMVAGRAKVCNVCHDIFFAVLFDDAGTIVNLAPIAITKYKNVELDAQDVAFLKGRVVGRLLTREIPFDPAVDAVSTATMSTSLVFDTLRRLRETYAAMVRAGLARP
jgi:hypothetical protein